MSTDVDAVAAAPHRLQLEGDLTIYQAAELKTRLLAALDQAPTTLELDLAGVTEIDSAGVQLLLLVRRMAAASQRELRLTGHSAPVREVFQLLDLAFHFGAPPPPDAAPAARDA